jgi:hypothetical protein
MYSICCSIGFYIHGMDAMRKTISIKLTPSEEAFVSHLKKRDITPTELLRDALAYYFELERQSNDELSTERTVNPVNQPVNHIQQESDQPAVNHTVYHAKEKPVNPVNQPVNHIQQENTTQTVNQPVNQTDTYLHIYLKEITDRSHYLEQEIQEWKNNYITEVQYLKEAYSSLQTDYHNHIKDSFNRIDDKFDRVLFHLEESRKPAISPGELPSQVTLTPYPTQQPTEDAEKQKPTPKPKKGWVFQMYRM